jgi:hypothetical protein
MLIIAIENRTQPEVHAASKDFGIHGVVFLNLVIPEGLSHCGRIRLK